MDELRQVIFNDILENRLVNYYGQTGYNEYRETQEEICNKLREQLSPNQSEQLEAFQSASSDAQLAELEAMFLATFDLCKSLAMPHIA